MQKNSEKEGDDDEIPDLVAGENFESGEAKTEAKTEEKAEEKAAEKPTEAKAE